MADPYIGEIRAFAFNFAPRGWAFCDGALLAIPQYTALFSVLGTIYGGNGSSTFGLPDMRGRGAMHWGSGAGLTQRVPGEMFGEDSVTLTSSQIPAHIHILNGGTITGTSTQKVAVPTSQAMFSTSAPGSAYFTDATPAVPFSPKAIGVSGGSQPHANNQPRLSLNFCISLSGIFPSRN